MALDQIGGRGAPTLHIDSALEPSRNAAPTYGGGSEVLALTNERWTAHDPRRTAATLMTKLGVSTDVIDKCLNHKLRSKVARVYVRDRRLAHQAKAPTSSEPN